MKKQTKKNLFNIAMASAVVTGSVVALAPADAQAAKNFTDLKEGDNFYSTIMNLVDRGIINGFPDNTFRAGEPITRAHAALIIAKVLDIDTENVTDPKFKDVPKSHPYYGVIAALANKGIIKGYPNGTYGMKDTLTRGQMAIIINRAFELEGQANNLPFTDAKGSVYESYVSTLFANGVTKGVSSTKFGLYDKVTRGQLATFVVKAEIASPEKVVDIKDGQLITTKGKYAIDAELAKVFNAANLAALKGAKIKLEEETTAFASLQTFVAAETAKLKLKSLTITASDATFDAGGYYIPNVTVNGTKVVVKNVVTEKITVAEGLTVELVGVEAKEVAIQGDTKLKLDATTKIEKIQVPVGKTLADVISNYEEVKDIVKDIVVVDEKGKEVKEEPTTPTPGGNTGGNTGGGGGGVTLTVNEKMHEAIKDFNTEFGTSISPFGTMDLNKLSNNEIGFTVATSGKTLSKVRTELKDRENDYTFAQIISKVDYLGTLYDEVNSMTVTIDVPEEDEHVVKVFNKTDLLPSESSPNRNLIVTLVDGFVSDVAPGTTTLGDFVDTFGTDKITVKIDYVNVTDVTYKIVLKK
ncbi:S-layer homology domain-containing protein [Ureibacillus sp. MALMAid1270]|uniref:S-layer homology domain-containing protein n=1 Tax=Ureibacillus sp. MALMAid1270 TaxID=3411629 RepID=UPI003BA751E4